MRVGTVVIANGLLIELDERTAKPLTTAHDCLLRRLNFWWRKCEPFELMTGDRLERWVFAFA